MTPLLEITRLGFRDGVRVFAKCENRNPLSSSHYDRVYERLFNLAITNGAIVKGETHLFETSSGNAGTAFAKFCTLYGFDGTIVFPSTVSARRLASVANERVRAVVSEHGDYMKGALRTALHLIKRHRQTGGKATFLDHSQTWEAVVAMQDCGKEIADQMVDLGVRPDVFISALGNGTSTTGIGLALKARYPQVKVVGFEPADAAVVSAKVQGVRGNQYQVTPLTGTGVWGIRFPNYCLDLIDDVQLIDSADPGLWESEQNEIERRFDESVGPTSGAAVHLARRLAERGAGKVYVLLFYDSREFYADPQAPKHFSRCLEAATI